MRPTLRFLAARGLLRLILSALFEVRVAGLDRLPQGPHILVANHLSWLDPFLMLACMPARPRIHMLGRRSAVANRFWKRWVLALIGGVVPVEPGHGELNAVDAAIRAVFQRGGVLGLFPEGSVGESEGELQTLRPGAVHFAHEDDVPVVPVGLAGTHELWLRRPIMLRIGPPLQLNGEVDADLDTLRRAMLANLPPVEDGEGARHWRWLTTLLR